LLAVGKIAYVPEPMLIRHHSGLPDIETVEEAKRLYFRKFSEDIAELHDRGIPVKRYHQFSLARNHYQRGNLLRGTKYLVRSTPPHPIQYLRLFWSLSNGIRLAISRKMTGS